MSEIKIVDKFINPRDHEELQNIMRQKEFPWTIAPKTGEMDMNGRSADPLNTQLNHWFADYRYAHYSPFFKYVLPILNQQRIIAISRIKANLQLPCENPIKSDFHVDLSLRYGIQEIPEPHLTTIIYYVNTNNGYTEFETGEKVESVENRAVIFPNSCRHRGVSQTDTHYRTVINLNVCLSAAAPPEFPKG
jgi:hypothetical protein